ncbi:transmembrane protein 164 [Drosophila grimshawi]|uniref:GH22818 n=1 Tax=Drosophila grimshawi TaxID=7222 RepID=B4JW40_DROGR|nr:transmembrane protein 164 [Drosophila grimshawi]XP_032596904.1 transmembrane protein 164 [Drosophila grimshawi]XP_032596905.1 transmembrane protein 164 [Drosophila grimshawi]XP_032596906.1 transmembrane protein 164 [Drosophila grimshawi]XP_043072297.1 transmembrane protein 164 [Drosophila grimshawi]EDV98178.1 GH22818 [Drosophila grimshawi]
MDWDWAVGGITDDIPRTTGAECINYMTDRRRWTESALLCALFVYIMHSSWKQLAPIRLPSPHEIQKSHSPMRLFLLISMSIVFGIEMGFKLAGRSMIFTLNPCHVQTCLQIYLLAAKPTRTTTALFRIQMSNLNGPFLAFIFPEVEGRTYPFEQAAYWIQHALLYIIPIYILRSGAYTVEDLGDFKWSKIGTAFMLFYHFALLSPLSILTGINLDHMLCAAMSDPFQGQNYRLFACCHQAMLCPLLSKGTALIFGSRKSRSNENGIHNNVALSSENYAPISDAIYHQLQQQQQQQLQQQQLQQHQDYVSAESLAGEYRMPTTKID